jgi:ubiquinone/menaquinone biosynthesis C-methylase UbiE
MSGPRQPHPFDPARAALLDDPDRERWFPSAAIVELLDVRPGMHVLDFGTGTARYALAVARAMPSAIVVAYDLQDEMRAIATERVRRDGATNVQVVGPGDPLLKEASFDRILALNLLHELDDADLSACMTYLRPDGTALWIDWDAEIPRDVGPPREHTHTAREARERLDRLGYRVQHLRDPRFPYHAVFLVRGEGRR